MHACVQMFGRRPAMLIALFLFGLGSALCGAAQNIPMLIGGRSMSLLPCIVFRSSLALTNVLPAIQGMGGGCIVSLTTIVISDLVPLKDRGSVNGMLGL